MRCIFNMMYHEMNFTSFTTQYTHTNLTKPAQPSARTQILGSPTIES